MQEKDIQWLTEPAAELRQHPNGTVLLMREKGGLMYCCVLVANIPTDLEWKFQRWPKGDTRTVEQMHKRGAEFALLRQ